MRDLYGYARQMTMTFDSWFAASGLSDREIGDALCTSKRTIGRWRKCERFPRPEEQVSVFVLSDGAVTPNDWLTAWFDVAQLEDLKSTHRRRFVRVPVGAPAIIGGAS